MLLIMMALLPVALGYTDLDDAVDFDQLARTPQVKDVVLCLLDQRPCSQMMMKYKEHASEAFDTACGNCTALQKHHFWAVLRALESSYPDLVSQLRQKYDPDGTHFKRLETEVARY